MRNYELLLDEVRSHESFLLTSHLFPDGDGLGSAVGLAVGLRKLGKDVRIMMPSAAAPRYAFLDPESEIRSWNIESRPADYADRQVVVVLDCSDWSRLSRPGNTRSELPLVKVCLDHQRRGEASFADVALLDEKAPATVERVYEWMVERCGLSLNRTMAQALYAALVTQTGGFQFSNTSARVHRVTAALLECGLDVGRVNIELNERNPPRLIAFLARDLETFAMGAAGRMAWVAVGPEVFRERGATADDTAGLVAYPRSIDGVELALMFFEDEPRSVKISLGSKRELDCSELARRLGGGGHARAAGALIRASLVEAVAQVTAAGEQTLQKMQRDG